MTNPRVAELLEQNVPNLRLGLRFGIGPFSFRLSSRPSIDLGAYLELIGDYQTRSSESYINFDITPTYRGRRWSLGLLRPQVSVHIDDQVPFPPHDASQLIPLLEWGLNWGTIRDGNSFVMLHAGVIAKGGEAALFPAHPGSGKSTLVASLDQLGWRLLSDEFALVDPESGCIAPYPRLVPLKNDAIDVFSGMFPDATLGPKIYNTRKGTLAHYKPTSRSISNTAQARPRYILFPEFQRESRGSLQPIRKEDAFIKLTSNSFNYHSMGYTGFRTLCNMLNECDTYLLKFGSADIAQSLITELFQTNHRN